MLTTTTRWKASDGCPQTRTPRGRRRNPWLPRSRLETASHFKASHYNVSHCKASHCLKSSLSRQRHVETISLLINCLIHLFYHHFVTQRHTATPESSVECFSSAQSINQFLWPPSWVIQSHSDSLRRPWRRSLRNNRRSSLSSSSSSTSSTSLRDQVSPIKTEDKLKKSKWGKSSRKK